MRVPFLACWPKHLPAGSVYNESVSSLDVLPTALAAAGREVNAEWKLDGLNLLPFLKGERTSAPHQALFWRWRSQAAVLVGKWKLVYLAPDSWWLFDTTDPAGEEPAQNQAIHNPRKAAELKPLLTTWVGTLQTPGLPKALNREEKMFYEGHFAGEQSRTDR